ncbi:MAG: Uma2 family endonuclease [Acidobacteria bacterium]|nr:Uma2 family endonuclease [Acidobacteriota bacterium]
MSTKPDYKYLTPEEYLAIERKAEYKSEYINGVMYAMAGGSPQHSLISGNVLTELNIQLRNSPCQVYNIDMKTRVPSSRRFQYPDVTVVCEEARFADDERDVLLNPLLIVEVLSDTTAAYDRTEKFGEYKEIESFGEYLLVAQDEPVVECFLKRPDGSWIGAKVEGLDQSVELMTINCRLKLKDVYSKVL